MNDLGTIARQSALHCEAKKHAYRQTQDGVVISFVLHPQEVPDGLATAALGTRYQLVVVEIGEDELPVTGEAPGPSTLAADFRTDASASRRGEPVSRPKQAWNDMAPSKQAGVLCGDPLFWKFIRERGVDVHNAESAAGYVRARCFILSRGELNTNAQAEGYWRVLVSQFRVWQREPEYVA